MKRHAMPLLATLSILALAVAGFAAPESKGVCAAGVGKPVCHKAYVANHCSHVTCCEVGNAAFFTSAKCGKCDEQAAEAAGKACASKSDSACAGKSATACAAKKHTASAKKDGACASHASACCGTEERETGNSGFFTAKACTAPVKSAKSAKGACCGAEKAKK